MTHKALLVDTCMWGKSLTVAVCDDAMMQGTLCRSGERQGIPEGERNHIGSACLGDICSQGGESLDQRFPKSSSSSGDLASSDVG